MSGENVFSELSSDLLQTLFASHNKLQLRLICRDIKAKIENYPDFILHLSPDGTQNASCNFFLQFKGKLSVGSRYGWNEQTGWFSSLLDAIKKGLRVDTLTSLVVNSLNLLHFSSKLNDACLSKIQKLYITFSGSLRSLSRSIASLSALCQVAENIDLTLKVLYRRPREVLKDVVDEIKGLDGKISLTSLAIRSVIPFALTYVARHCIDMRLVYV